jgi:HSP20 family protein
MLHRSLIPVASRRANRLFHDSMVTPWLGDLLSPLPAAVQAASPLQVRGTEDAYTVRCELPGFEQDEVAVELTGDVLVIRAQRKAQESEWETRASYAHTVRLEDPVDAEKVQAELKNGVLLVTLPKSEAGKPRKIAVKSATPTAAPPQLEQSAEPKASS